MTPRSTPHPTHPQKAISYLRLQNALWQVGAVPREQRTDSLTAAVKKIKKPERFTDRYQELLDHYGLVGSHSQAGKAHENGDVEQAHHRLKTALEQELILRGSGDFASLEQYREFLQELLKRRNDPRQKKLCEELAVMRRLPDRRLEDFSLQRVKVSRNSIIRVGHNTYSVNSRLIDEWVQVRIYADRLQVWYGDTKVEEMARLRGERKHDIQYRHVIDSLIKKPGAFRRYRWREDLFPSVIFRVAYDELCRDCPQTADRQYLQILWWAAKISQQRVQRALQQLVKGGERIRAGRVKERLDEGRPEADIRQLCLDPVELSVYDGLISSGTEVRA